MLAYMNDNDVDNNLRAEIKAKLESVSNDAEDDGRELENEEIKDEIFIDEWDKLSDTEVLAHCYGWYDFSFCIIQILRCTSGTVKF